jgi:hypothetical protein
MKNRNIKLKIHGVIFDDFLIRNLKKKDFNKKENSVIKREINHSLGGIGNILNLNFKKNTLLNLYSDKNKKNHRNINYNYNFKSNPSAVIFDNFNSSERFSIVSEGKIKTISNINVKNNELFLGYYIECLPVKITKNEGTIVFDFNNSPAIISEKIFVNNLLKSNYILKSIGETNKIINKNSRKFNFTLIEHDPRKVIITIFKKHRVEKEIIKNPFFKINKKRSVGLGDLFAYYFCKNLIKNIDLKKNIMQIFKQISLKI